MTFILLTDIHYIKISSIKQKWKVCMKRHIVESASKQLSSLMRRQPGVSHHAMGLTVSREQLWCLALKTLANLWEFIELSLLWVYCRRSVHDIRASQDQVGHNSNWHASCGSCRWTILHRPGSSRTNLLIPTYLKKFQGSVSPKLY